MKNIDDMRVGDFLYLLDCMQEECCEHKRCSECRYNGFCDDIDLPSIDSVSLRKTIEGYAEANGLLEHMHYMNDQKWIPVSKRLPNRHQRVLCYLKYEPESPDIILENTYIGGGMWMSERDKVVAWMPLPEPYTPYKGEHNEKH